MIRYGLNKIDLFVYSFQTNSFIQIQSYLYILHLALSSISMLPIKKQPKKVANVQKNFMYQCQICYQDYDNKQHKPMIICSNFHALCLTCVNSNLFKMQYNSLKNPTGRFMCSKCSQIIDKTFIRQHHILKEVCNYIGNIKQKDEEMRKEFYNYVGSMGMNLVAMREDFDSIEKSNILLKKENQQLVRENCRVREDYASIEKAAGSYEELKKVMRQLEQTKETLQFYKAKLQSLIEQFARKNRQLQLKKDQCLKQNQRFFEINTQLSHKRQELKTVSRKSLQLIEHNQGAINLKEYLEQQINNLQNEKKKLAEENMVTKKKIDSGIKKMQTYWESLLKNPFQSEEEIEAQRPKLNQSPMKKIEEKPVKQLSQKAPVLSQKKEQKKPVQELNSSIIVKFDQTQKSFKYFLISKNAATLTNSRLNIFTHISFSQPFTLTSTHSFTIKITRLTSRQIIIGLMTPECKNKKNIYNKTGFYGYDGWSKMWVDGDSVDGKLTIKQGDVVKVSYFVETNVIQWETEGEKMRATHKLPVGMRNKKLYPVVMLIDDEDGFQVIRFE